VASNDSIKKTLLVAVALCIVCSLVVSGAAVLLKPAQIKNKALDRKSNILAAAGMLEPGQTSAKIEEEFLSKITPKIVDLDAGRYTQEPGVSNFEQRKVAKNPKTSINLSDAEDVANISRRENYAIVYLVEIEGKLDKIILPVHGYGLWSTLYGFLALESDLNTIAGFGFYDHGETPGLGGEVDNPKWKHLWLGKQVYAQGDVAIEVVKGSVDASKSGAEYQVDGLSGATLTSNGVSNLLEFWMGEMGYKQFLTNLKSGEA
jgi:Na+-transporting NADH:ubiquinone oxidoreductase subunit C